MAEEALKLDQMTIRHLAKVIGKLVSTFPAVQFGPLYHRTLEVAKTKALQKSKGNFDFLTITSEAIKLELTWWIDNIGSSFSTIYYMTIFIQMHPC